MSNLTIRAISAIVALTVLFGTIYFFQAPGLAVLCQVIAVVGIYDMSLLFFKDGYPRWTKTAFLVLGCLNLFFSIPIILIFSFILSVLGALIFHKKFTTLDAIILFVSKLILGLIYSALLPALVIALFRVEHGILWFSALIAVVFSGDTGAYIIGSLFGKTKVAPLLSPKKSWQGSLGGLFFSTLAGFAFSFFIPGATPQLMILLGLFGGILGQTGDFFESLVKRVAGVKDSGSIMPGHGGVLDRVDGVYFASPLFFVAVYYIIK